MFFNSLRSIYFSFNVAKSYNFVEQNLLSIPMDNTEGIVCGIKCPKCEENGNLSWLIPGFKCTRFTCATPTDNSTPDKSKDSSTPDKPKESSYLDKLREKWNNNSTTPNTGGNNSAVECAGDGRGRCFNVKFKLEPADIYGGVPKECFESPLDQFTINGILDVKFLDGNIFSLSNMGLYLIAAVFIIVFVYVVNNNYYKLINNTSNINQESIYITAYSIVTNQINEFKGKMFFPLIFTLFVFILSNNLVGMIPYSFASTSHFIVTFSLSFTIVLGATLLGLDKHVLKFFSILVPEGCPLLLLPLLVLIEFISYIARNISLGLRLAANVLSGHMLLNILSGFTYKIMKSGYLSFFIALLPLSFIIAFFSLEIGIAFIQAQVFVVLSGSYIRDGLNLH